MHPLVELNLALLLFLPWYGILAFLYWRFPRAPSGPRRLAFDAGALALATLATVVSLHWSYGLADRAYGGMWRQVLATSVSYGVFLAVMTAAWFLRRRALSPSRPEAPP